ncbi:hypothetical protein TNIN_250781 [Trichonephila inaurata madagascariensis]|uniref:Uncharacterized protein n=1 Tax=Trichonephila inaurata madagascariensis TaxID=2747483 RepID=A0A8X6XW13_9ARAC|nr:hypothetical protein TNIN_250781 [Trichonephila inaurata madagascariensis]
MDLTKEKKTLDSTKGGNNCGCQIRSALVIEDLLKGVEISYERLLIGIRLKPFASASVMVVQGWQWSPDYLAK